MKIQFMLFVGYSTVFVGVVILIALLFIGVSGTPKERSVKNIDCAHGVIIKKYSDGSESLSLDVWGKTISCERD